MAPSSASAPPAAPPVKKAQKFKRALKSAARLPVRVSSVTKGRGSGRNNYSPRPNEQPIVIFRLQIIGCMHLLAKDRNGTSDPFVVASILNNRQHTSVAKKTVNPTYAPKDATFDFPIYMSLADKVGVLEIVVWDKDMLSKEYLGETGLPLDEWFHDKEGNPRAYAWDDSANKAFSLNLLSTRSNTVATGSVQLKIGFVSPPNTQNLMDWEDIYGDLVKRSRPSLVSSPPTEGVGTVPSNEEGPAYEDDGGLSSDSGSDEEDEEDEAFVDALDSEQPSPEASLTLSTSPQASNEDQKKNVRLPDLTIQPDSPATPTLLNTPTPTQSSAPTPRISTGFIPRMKFPKRFSSKSIQPVDPSLSSTPSSEGSSTPAEGKMKKFGKSSGGAMAAAGGSGSGMGVGVTSEGGKKKKSDYRLEGDNDIVGIVMLEIQSAEDLPRLSNMMRTGWDMDPFVVVSFGKKVFRTRVIRHSRNPVWDEKLLFHVRRYETAYKVQLGIHDWDKLSSNDHIGDANFDVKDLLDSAPQPDPVTGLYASSEDGNHPMMEYTKPLSTAKGMLWESKHNPTITLRAKYQPYDALRQRFWRQYLKQYDTDDTNALSHLELTSMLDSLGSTLTHSTISSFFTRFGKNHHTDELTVEEAILCLETELGRPQSEKKRLDADDVGDSSSVGATPLLQLSDGQGKELKLDELDFSGKGRVTRDDTGMDVGHKPPTSIPIPTASKQQTFSQVANRGGATTDSSDDTEEGDDDLEREAADTLTPPTVATQKKRKIRFMRAKKQAKSAGDSDSAPGGTATPPSGDDSVERVINVKNCPLCHRPRMNSKAEIDIITHLAVCASQDWNAIDKIVVGNFVTASQAQRKWYTRVLSKVSSGDYKLGANSANIIVQNRITGQLEEEKMQVYVRLGIRLLYKGASSRMEGTRARRLLKSLSIKQGVKYDDPASAAEIPTFIEFHNLDVNEILDPLDSFKTFNEFFYRKLKSSARPVESPDDPYRLVSVADCRMMTFESVQEATRLWIKGREFTVARLLGDTYKDQADRYNGGALAIFRLAPQDYHRFHSPVDGTIGPMTYIAGEYYTVNPQAIRTALDVYGENARKIVPIDSPQFGRVMAVCVGAMMVGSIATTVDEGDKVARGQEFGYFAFGGSTIVVLFEKGVLQWDEDLLINGKASLETLVRVGMGVGKGFPKV